MGEERGWERSDERGSSELRLRLMWLTSMLMPSFSFSFSFSFEGVPSSPVAGAIETLLLRGGLGMAREAGVGVGNRIDGAVSCQRVNWPHRLEKD